MEMKTSDKGGYSIHKWKHSGESGHPNQMIKNISNRTYAYHILFSYDVLRKAQHHFCGSLNENAYPKFYNRKHQTNSNCVPFYKLTDQ